VVAVATNESKKNKSIATQEMQEDIILQTIW
jgi:hypothetical protein